MKYSLDIYNREVLIISGNLFIQYYIAEDNDLVKITCNSISKTMNVEIITKQGELHKEIDKSSIIYDTVIDLGNQGERWEGPGFNSLPYGFGNHYDNSGFLIYSGFMYGNTKVGFGCDYFPGTHTKEYSGGYLNNKRHGYGILYDRQQQVVFEGTWINGVTNYPTLIEVFKCNHFINSMVESLIIGDFCDYKELYYLDISYYPKLNQLSIGSHCFWYCMTCVISHCEELRSIHIKDNSFSFSDNTRDSILVKNCPKLQTITIEHDCFKSFVGKCNFSSITSLLMVNRSTFFNLSTNWQRILSAMFV